MVLVLGYICIVALNASALSLLIKYILPSVAEQGYMYSLAGWDVYLAEVIIASVALVVFAYLNIRGTTISGRMQFIFVICMLVGIGILTIGAVSHPSASFSNLDPLFKPDVSMWSSVIVIVAIAPWAFVGFDNIPQAAEEFNFPPKKGFMLIILSLICAGLVYIFMITATALAAPWQDLANLQWGTGDAMTGIMGTFGLIILATALTMGVCTGLNGFSWRAAVFCLQWAVHKSYLMFLQTSPKAWNPSCRHSLHVCGMFNFPLVRSASADMGCRYVVCRCHHRLYLYMCGCV